MSGPERNNLRGLRAYLCGAMDRVDDGGEGWRNAIGPQLEALGVQILNPCDKPIDIGYEDAAVRGDIARMKAAGDFDGVAKYRAIRTTDLRMVDISDFLVVSIDTDLHACGTYEEIFWANRQKKPVLVVMEQGKDQTPNWLLFTLPHEHIFSNSTELLEHLYDIDARSDTASLVAEGRWYVFNI